MRRAEREGKRGEETRREEKGGEERRGVARRGEGDGEKGFIVREDECERGVIITDTCIA